MSEHPRPAAAQPTEADPSKYALSVRGLSCSYPGDGAPVHALREVDIDIARGSFTAIMGPSGSGKTTLLHCAAGLQTPSAGRIRLAGHDLATLNQTQLTELRRREVGFVFQSFNLLAALTASENVELPLRLDGRQVDRHATFRLLEDVGLAQRTGHRPGQLSGGQRQRVAVARALSTNPAIVFADEPTGALDIHSAREVLALLRRLADGGQTIVMVTHDPSAAAYSDEVLFLADGQIVDRIGAPTARDVGARMAALVENAERAINRSAVPS